MKSLRAGVIACCILSAAGSSLLEQFVVLNRSPGVVSVKYSATTYTTFDGKKICSLTRNAESGTPVVYPADVVRKDVDLWKNASSASTYEFSVETCSMEVEVQPGQALLVWSALNGEKDPFLTTVVVVDGAATKIYDSPERQRHFRRLSQVLYTIEYRGSIEVGAGC